MKINDLCLLGFARKSGNLSVGMDASVTAIKRGKAQLLFLASDISEKSKKEIEFLCHQHNVKIHLSEFTMDCIAEQIGKRAGILSVNSKQFAQSILNKISIGGNADDNKI